jgi:hypothetical protein
VVVRVVAAPIWTVLPMVAPTDGAAARDPRRLTTRSNPALGRMRERRDAL